MASVRFVNADEEISSLSIITDYYHIRELSFGEVTPYYDTMKQHIEIYHGTKLLFNYNFKYIEGHYTIAVAPKGEFVLYKDDRSNLEQGQAGLYFYNLSPLLPNASVGKLDKEVVIKNLDYLQSRKAKMALGNYVNTFVVKSGDVEVTMMINPTNLSKNSIFLMSENDKVKYLLVEGEGSDVLAKDFLVQQYMGEWNLIAQFPQPYEAAFKCVNQKAIYTLLYDGVKVHNLCIDDKGNIANEVYGKAIVPNPLYPAALQVSFPNPVGYQAKGANYLVHKVKYEKYAVVGNPNRASFYILARAKHMNKKTFARLVEFGRNLGYDMDKLVIMKNALI